MEQLTAERDGQFKEIRRQLSYVELQIPAEVLRELTIIDSPGLNADNEHHTEVTERFLGRADFAIFLFHALYVGSATELKWLKKFSDHGISPYGIINRIDELNDDQLEELIDNSQRRFGHAVQGLFGISALDALDGKLQKNDKLLQWSNWGEVDKLLHHLKKQTNRKIERAYTRLTEPMKQMDGMFLQWKMSLPLNKFDHDRAKEFTEKDIPELLSLKKQLDYNRAIAETVHNSWLTILNLPVDSIKSTEQLLRNFMELYGKPANERFNYISQLLIGQVPKNASGQNQNRENGTALSRDPLQEWNSIISNQFYPFSEKRQAYHLLVDQCNAEREKLENRWKDLYYRSTLFKKHKLMKHKNKLAILNEEQGELVRKKQDLTIQFDFMKTKINELENDLQTSIDKDMNTYAEQERLLLETWNWQLAETRKSFNHISETDNESIEEFSHIPH